MAFAGSALIAVSHGGVQFGTAALIVLLMSCAAQYTSTPGETQIGWTAKSGKYVITGTGSRPLRRSGPSSWLAIGYVDTTAAVPAGSERRIRGRIGLSRARVTGAAPVNRQAIASSQS